MERSRDCAAMWCVRPFRQRLACRRICERFADAAAKIVQRNGMISEQNTANINPAACIARMKSAALVRLTRHPPRSPYPG